MDTSRDAGRRECSACLAEELVSAARPVEVHALTVEQLLTSTNGDDGLQRAPLALDLRRIDRQRVERKVNSARIRTPPGRRRCPRAGGRRVALRSRSVQRSVIATPTLARGLDARLASCAFDPYSLGGGSCVPFRPSSWAPRPSPAGALFFPAAGGFGRFASCLSSASALRHHHTGCRATARVSTDDRSGAVTWRLPVLHRQAGRCSRSRSDSPPRSS